MLASPVATTLITNPSARALSERGSIETTRPCITIPGASGRDVARSISLFTAAICGARDQRAVSASRARKASCARRSPMRTKGLWRFGSS